jgi:GxxExxY protein
MLPRYAGCWSVLALGCGAKLGFRRIYKGEPLSLGFRADILADEIVILEMTAVPALLPVHDMQLQTYLRTGGLPVGLQFNTSRR